MRIEQLGKAFMLLSVLLLLGLGAANLLTIGLYGNMSTELIGEQSARQQLEAANWSLQISAALRAAAKDTAVSNKLTARFNELSSGASGPSAVAVYSPDGKLQVEWLRPQANLGTESDLAERKN